MLAQRGFAMPDRVMRALDEEPERRPLFVTLYYSRGAMKFSYLSNLIALFARGYFDQFGTAEPAKPE